MIPIKLEIRTLPVPLLQEEALLRRLPDNHPKRGELKDSLSRRYAGHRGETTLDYYLRFLPHQHYHVHQGCRLIVFGQACQMDTLVLTPHVGFIIEVKNMKGTLSFDENTGQFKRTTEDGKIRSNPSPLLQVGRHQLQFEKWLHFQKIFSYPIIPLIAISNPSAILDFPTRNTYQWKITHSENIPSKIKAIEQKYQRKGIVDIPLLEDKLHEENRPPHYNILKNFGVESFELLTGVQCPMCQKYEMRWERKRWECLMCGHRSLYAERQAIADYFLLLNTFITASACRDFLHLNNRHQALRLLKRIGLQKVNNGKATYYKRPNDIYSHLLK